MKILLVDDDRFIHEIIVAALATQGHDIEHAFDTAHAMNIFTQNPDIDLVITDIVMPGEDGTKLIRHIKSINPALPVLAMTGGIENAVNDYVELARLYSDFTLAKPFKRADFLAGIQSAIENAAVKARDNTPEEALFDNLLGILEKFGKNIS